MFKNWKAPSDGRLLYLLLFLFALGLRLAYVAQQAQHNPLFDFPVVDARVYSTWADEIVSGHWWWPDLRNYLPVYPWFIAVCKWFFFGESAWGVKIVQSVLSSTACVLLAAMTARLFGMRAGLIAGLLFAGNWMFVIYDAERYSESLCLFAITVCLHQLLCAAPGWRRTVISGLACAVAAGCRPNLIPLILLGAAWVFFTDRKDKLAHAGAFIAMSALIFIPVLYHNHQISGRWMLRAQQSWNLYAGLDPAIEGLHPAAGIAFDKYMLKPVIAGHLTHEAQDVYWKQQAFELLRDRPGAMLSHFVLRRGAIFLSATEWSQEFDVYAFRDYSRLLSLPWPGFGWVFPLACAGLAATALQRRWKVRVEEEILRKRRFLLICLVVVAVFTFLGKVTGRYRLPVTLLLIPYAAVGLECLLTGPLHRKIVPFILFCFAGLICWPDWTGLKDRQTALHDYYIGIKYREQGRLDDAGAALRRATSVQPWNADAPAELARVLRQGSQSSDAMAAVSEALRREPQFWKAWNLKGLIALETNNHTLAVECADRSLAIYPFQSEPWMIRRRIDAALGDWPKEKLAFEKAIEFGAGAPFIMAYGLRLEEKKQLEQALQQYRDVAGDPSNSRFDRARACMLAARLLAMELQREDRAREVWMRMAGEFTDVPFFAHQARFLLGTLSQDEYRAHVEALNSQTALAFYDFNCGLHWLGLREFKKAEASFRECLARGKYSPEMKTPPDTLPEKWAWMGLRSARAGK